MELPKARFEAHTFGELLFLFMNQPSTLLLKADLLSTVRIENGGSFVPEPIRKLLKNRILCVCGGAAHTQIANSSRIFG
jgi:hypothetical protein